MFHTHSALPGFSLTKVADDVKGFHDSGMRHRLQAFEMLFYTLCLHKHIFPRGLVEWQRIYEVDVTMDITSIFMIPFTEWGAYPCPLTQSRPHEQVLPGTHKYSG